MCFLLCDLFILVSGFYMWGFGAGQAGSLTCGSIDGWRLSGWIGEAWGWVESRRKGVVSVGMEICSHISYLLIYFFLLLCFVMFFSI